MRDSTGSVAGVSIRVKNTNRGTTTDANGNFVLNAAVNERLVFSFIGYETQEVVVNDKVINVSLHQSGKLLGDVVVVALGITRNKNELPYAAQTVTGIPTCWVNYQEK